ncbi:MAG: SurA N-terminal domain-containing protein [Spirochaetaceae bacterium]|jgi:hypothetical protein|nr:SurA N-terminal domain-containing protein [Spirochaetaceae bacterium]
MKKRLILPALILLSAATVFAQNDLKTVATVTLTKTEPITVKMLKEQVRQMESALGRPLDAGMRREVLSSMINERLALQAAEKEKITVTDAEVNQQFNELRSQLGQMLGRAPTDAEFNDAIRQQTGMELSVYREQAKKALTIQKYLMAKKQDVLRSIKEPTEAEIAKEYDINSTDLVQPETVEFSAIVFPVANDAEKNKKREEANKMAREINNNPENFDDKLQRGKSPNAGYNVSQRGIIQKNATGQQQVGQAFLEEALKLEQGKISKVLEIPSGQARGYYIIKIAHKYPKKFLTLEDTHLLYGETVRTVLRETIMRKRQQEVITQAQQELVNELRKGNPYKIFEENLNY